jgi:hypothetical protein
MILIYLQVLTKHAHTLLAILNSKGKSGHWLTSTKICYFLQDKLIAFNEVF